MHKLREYATEANWVKVSALALLIALAACIRCIAGTTGVLNGYVRDASGKAAANALVSVLSPSEREKTYTDQHGFFVFLSLPPDVYSISVEKPGTSNAYALGARIESDQTISLNFRFHNFRRCPAFTRVTIAANRGGDDYLSLDVPRMERYPSTVAPLITLPLLPAARRLGCM